MRIGSGRHVYDQEPGWGALPAGSAWGLTHGVVVDSSDRVHVHNRSRDAVAVFDRDGRFLHSWGEEFAAGAHGLYLQRAASGEEFLLLADPVRHLVVRATLDGRILLRLGVPDLPEAYPTADRYRPTDAAAAPNGDIYVCDGYGQGWIHQYTPGGERIRSFGGPGELDCPHGIWVDTRGAAPALLVADRGHGRIRRYDLEGNPVGETSEGLRRPCCFWQFENELVVPDLHARVTILGADDRPVAQLGDDPGAWDRPGWPDLPAGDRRPDRFIAPHAAAVDSLGDLYVVEWVPGGRLSKWRRSV